VSLIQSGDTKPPISDLKVAVNQRPMSTAILDDLGDLGANDKPK